MRRPAALLLLGLLASACGPPGAAPRAPSPSPTSSPSAVPIPTTASPELSCPQRVLGSLSEDQRVGQLIFVGLAANQLGSAERAAITGYEVGSVWYTELSAQPAAGVAATGAAVQELATRSGPVTVRLLVGANQEGGQIDQLHGSGFSAIPSAVVQGQEAPDRLRADAALWGRQLIAAGVNLEVAPVLDTVPAGTDATNAPIGQLQREFGHDPATVADHGVAFIEGMHDAGEAVVAKHFPGLGRVAGNTDFAASVTDTVTTADDPYLHPFAAAVSAGADMVMVSTAVYTKIDPQRAAAFSPVVLDLLRTGLHFEGVIVSDDLGAAASVQAMAPGDRAVDFVAAGGDLVTVKYAALVEPMAGALRARAAADPAFRRRVDDAALRVLTLKARYGLLAC